MAENVPKMKTIKLVNLVGGPLPTGNLKGSVIVTIWLVFLLAFALQFRHILRRSVKPTWIQFINVYDGIRMLVLWYIYVVIDRWIHYDAYRVRAGYIVLGPIFEPARIASTFFFLSGLFKVVWRADSSRHFGWWVAGRAMTFLILIVSLFYIVLYLALAGCWLEFTSLNVIADIATKRIHFEIATAGLFMGYAFLVFVAAAVSLLIRASRIDGVATADRIYAAIAAFLLFSRCLLDFIIVLLIYGPRHTRASIQLSYDIAYGTLTVLTIIALLVLASQVAPHIESSNEDKLRIQANIRKAIIDRLESETSGGAGRSPPLGDVISFVESAVQSESPELNSLFENSRMAPSQNRATALAYLVRVRSEEGRREPKGSDDSGSKAGTPFSALLGRLTGQPSRNSATSDARLMDRQGSRVFTPGSIERPSVTPGGRRSASGGDPVPQPWHQYQPSIQMPQFDPAESIQMRSVRQG